MDNPNESIKAKVRDFWNESSCGEKLYLDGCRRSDYLKQAEERYRLEPYIVHAESLLFKEGSFDIVYSGGVLHHTPNIALALDKVYRVCKL